MHRSGFEPELLAWKAKVIPLDHRCRCSIKLHVITYNHIYYLLKKKRPFTSTLDPKGTKFKILRNTINTLCEDNYMDSTFSKVKSTLKTSLKEQLGINYYGFYIIKDFDNNGIENNKPGRADHNYRIPLEPSYVTRKG